MGRATKAVFFAFLGRFRETIAKYVLKFLKFLLNNVIITKYNFKMLTKGANYEKNRT